MIAEVKGSDKWNAFYGAGAGNVYPDENLIRLVRGKYADIPKSGRMIDVGFGRGANPLFFAQNGYEAHGLDVSQASVEAGHELAKRSGVPMTLGILQGTKLPYDDHYFD